MKLKVVPLLERNNDNDSYFEVDNIQPRQFVNLLDQYKALLFQSNDAATLLSTDDFGQFVTDLQLEQYPYIGGAAPRTIIPTKAGNDIVFTANESPPDQPIPFHHELAQRPNPPEYIFFYCHTPSETGGETPIIDSTAVYRFAKDNHPDFINKLHKHGARYIRTLPEETDPSSPIGRSYKETWNVTNRTELETKLSNIHGCTWEWNDNDGSVRITSEIVPALRLVTDHCQNYIYQYVFANSIIAAYIGWQDCRNDRHNSIRFGDMTHMDENILQSIANYMEQHRIMYTWKQGDIMAINNQLVMHSRNPFTGIRRVYASIWGPPKKHIREMETTNGVAIGQRSLRYYELLNPSDPLIFGFWKISKDICIDVCYNAIVAGYRRLDCACDYGNEVEVGIGIQRAIKDGICKREDLFITGKLWNTYHKPVHVKLAFERTMKDLQLDYIDEYLIHFPISMEYVPFEDKYPPEWTNMDGKMILVPNDMGETWKAMEELVDQGLCRTIGVCNFSTQLLRQLLSTCHIRPSTLQIELHPHNTQENLVRFAHDAGIHVTGFSTLGASSYIELNMANKDDILLNNKVIINIAKEKQKSPAQILIRWTIQRNIKPLCKSINIEHMKENRNIFDFYLTNYEMKQINNLNKNHRYNDPGKFCIIGMGTFCPIYD